VVGAVAKSYMTNGLLIYGEIFAQFLIYVSTGRIGLNIFQVQVQPSLPWPRA
jgi:hypothetical protein